MIRNECMLRKIGILCRNGLRPDRSWLNCFLNKPNRTFNFHTKPGPDSFRPGQAGAGDSGPCRCRPLTLAVMPKWIWKWVRLRIPEQPSMSLFLVCYFEQHFSEKYHSIPPWSRLPPFLNRISRLLESQSVLRFIHYNVSSEFGKGRLTCCGYFFALGPFTPPVFFLPQTRYRCRVEGFTGEESVYLTLSWRRQPARRASFDLSHLSLNWVGNVLFFLFSSTLQ